MREILGHVKEFMAEEDAVGVVEIILILVVLTIVQKTIERKGAEADEY